ncbi:MAG TPA: ATP-dependent RNA helicase RhlB [Xanthomonadales bacterium]|nr:ATP-dependent RNA helicase RhlB [Xanthomonadales bacterium]
MSHTDPTGAPADATPPAPQAAESDAPALDVRETVVADTRPLTDVTFDSFELHPLLRAGLEESGFLRTTPIQAMTLPMTLAGKDIAGQAQTGTGKTLAFLVTILNRLLSNPARADRRAADPRAVVLAPTRELAIQIEKDARAIARQSGLRFALIYGGVDYDKQRELLRAGTDVVIATPGRLIDYVKQHVVSLGATEIVVLDEADRMFDLGFIKDIRFLLRKMPAREERQSLLFSATLSHRVLELAYEHMNDAQKLVVETDNVTADRVRQVVYLPANEEKLPLLIGLLSRMDAHRTMVFVNTKVWCEKVARALERAHFSVGVLSGDVPQSKREKLLAKFKRGELEILVATDVAARGLHIPDVSHVFNYDLPFDAEDYVHRIGRTARLGAEGDAISFACELYAMSLPDIEKYIGQSIPRSPVDPALLEPVKREPRVVQSFPDVVDEADSHIDTKMPPKPEKGGGGGGRSRSGGPGGGRGGRSGSSRGPRREGERREGGPRREHGDSRTGTTHAERVARVEARREGIPAEPANAAVAADPAKRKRRRRRRGERKPPEATMSTGAASATPASAPAPASEPLLGRIKRSLKSLLNRLPVPGRRR